MEKRVENLECRVDTLDHRVMLTESIADKTVREVRYLEEKVRSMERALSEEDEVRSLPLASAISRMSKAGSFSSSVRTLLLLLLLQRLLFLRFVCVVSAVLVAPRSGRA